MIYKIPPFANPNEGMPYVTWNNAFSKDENDLIIKIGDSLPFNEAGVVSGIDQVKTDDLSRISNTSWITYDNTTSWLYDKITNLVRRMNGEFYRFDIDGMYENMQFTIYEGTRKAFYNWHQDIGVYSSGSVTRKISLSMLLNEPDNFEGGDLEIWGSKGVIKAPKVRGAPIVFPSYLLHRVTPVTKGIRKSLVIWFGGPAFK